MSLNARCLWRNSRSMVGVNRWPTKRPSLRHLQRCWPATAFCARMAAARWPQWLGTWASNTTCSTCPPALAFRGCGTSRTSTRITAQAMDAPLPRRGGLILRKLLGLVQGLRPEDTNSQSAPVKTRSGRRRLASSSINAKRAKQNGRVTASFTDCFCRCCRACSRLKMRTRDVLALRQGSLVMEHARSVWGTA